MILIFTVMFIHYFIYVCINLVEVELIWIRYMGIGQRMLIFMNDNKNTVTIKYAEIVIGHIVLSNMESYSK